MDVDRALGKLRAATADRRPYRFAVVDATLLDRDYRELVQTIKNDRDITAVSVILLTPFGQHSDGEAALAAGFRGYLTKPVRESQLHECLSTAGDGRQARTGKAIAANVVSTRTFSSHILVVEDNAVNQELMVKILKKLGYTASVANNGEEAVEAVAQQHYDLVFMDCQMPILDGYEATGRIRSRENDGQHTIIIAMTANTMPGDKDKCIASGMDDYIPKPLDISFLKARLEHWLPDAQDVEPDTVEGPRESGDAPGGALAPETDAPDTRVVDELHELIGDEFRDVIQSFIAKVPSTLETLREAVQSEDHDRLLKEVHSLKGSCSNLGVHRLTALCKELEEMGRAKNTSGATELMARMEWEYASFRKAVEPIAFGEENTRITPASPDAPIVLVVEDDKISRLMLRQVLEREGYHVEEATDGMQAVSTYERLLPDLILMDAVMPVMDGFEACAAIKKLPTGNTTPVLIITALDDEESVERAFNAGASDYIHKPIHWAVLRQRVRRIINESHAEKHINRLAFQDTLTELPNRRLFIEDLKRKIATAHHNNTRLALLFLDLDGFKIINDTLGHDAGDLLLQAVAQRLGDLVRTDDMVARLGGDEFTILLEGVSRSQDAAGVAEKILEDLSRPFTLNDKEVFVTGSIGISLYPSDGNDIGSLIKNADTAMYRAKEHGRNNYQFYTADMGAKALERLVLESHLRKALERNEFTLHYQPQIELQTGDITGFEALLRWDHPELGLVSPGEFIPLLEETGLIVRVGEWVLRAACEQNKLWHNAGLGPFRMSVNLSGRQLGESNLAGSVAGILERIGLDPTLLELEITESAIMSNTQMAGETLDALHAKGISLAVDDFGTGYSSLSYLKRFPINTLKIDRSFVRDVPGDADDVELVKTIIAMAHSLKLEVIAEGVEHTDQLIFLRDQGCMVMQGFLFSRPLPVEDIEEFLKNKHRMLKSAL